MTRRAFPHAGGSYRRLRDGALQRLNDDSAPAPAQPPPEPTLDPVEAMPADADITAKPEE
jgi:hypothetical protein